MSLLVADDLWAAVAPLLPPEPAKPKGGRPRASDRAAPAGILLVLRTGMQGREVPAALGCCGKTCLLAAAARLARGRGLGGVASRLAGTPAAQRRRPGLVARRARPRQRACQKGGAATGPNPTDRGKPGTKRHLVTDARGTPLGLTPSGANRHDSRMPAPTLDAVPGVRGGRRGRPRRRRPAKLHADDRYDHRRCRAECRARGVAPRIARRGIESGERLGRHRWVVERTLAWPARFRRLTVRYERRADLHLALATLACAIICLNQTRRFCPQF